jgi:hypothetical protein
MSREQNIDDILKLLKDSVSVESDGSQHNTEVDVSEDISEETLKEQLRVQYFYNEATMSDENAAENREYSLDTDFLKDAIEEEISFDKLEEAEAETTLDTDVPEESDTGYDASLEIQEQNVENNENDDDDEEFELVFDERLEKQSEEDEIEGTKKLILDDFILTPNNEPSYVEADNDDIFTENEDLSDEEELTAEEESVAYAEELSIDLKDLVLDTSEKTAEETAEDTEQEQPQESTEELLSVEDIDEFKEYMHTEESDVSVTEDSDTEQVDLEDNSDTFIATMKKVGLDFSNDPLVETQGKSSADESEDAPYMEDVEGDIFEDDLKDVELDYSTINLMMQFCEKDELDKKLGDEKIENYLKHEQSEIVDEQITSAGFGGEEYSDEKQNESIYETYRRNHLSALARLCGCAFVAIIATVFELIPLLEININGLLDYNYYPAVYLLFGLQFVVFSTAICYKQLWLGLKRAFSNTPSKDSVVAVILLVTVVYDIVVAMILAFSKHELPPVFNALASVTVAFSAAADYIRTLAEMRSFSVYSSDSKKFTMVKEGKKGRAASKMYAGGMPSEKAVYSIKAIDFPRGFFKCVGDTRKTDKIFVVATIPVLVISLVATILTIILGAGAFDTCAIFLLTLYVLLPITYICTATFPNAFAMLRLAKRGSAVAGEAMINKYQKCDVMVFEDLHMFRKCKTEEIGIAIYDTKIAYLTLGCVDALYQKIGGPLSGMKMQLPDVFKFNDVSIRRITRNGIEAVIDKKHVLIVGEAAFMQRYGLSFPENEKQTDRSTLCVSVNGGVTAKLSVRYETEPVFEMIIERLAAEGILCAIETYDPLINSAMLQKARTLGESSVSVIHMNPSDFIKKEVSDFREELDGVVSCSSKLKLAETEVWLKRLSKINKTVRNITIGFSCLGAVLITLVAALRLTSQIDQFYVLLYLLLQVGVAAAVMLLNFPSKRYFTTDALYYEYEKKYQKQMKKAEKKNS